MKARRRISLSSGSRCTIAWRPSRSRAMMDPSAATRPRAQARRAESMLISPVNWPGPSNATGCSRPATGRTISIPPLITTKKSVFWSPASNRSSPAWTPRCWPAAEMRESWASVRRGNICSYRSMYPGGYATGTQYAIDRANSFRGDCGWLAPAPELLLEPVMGVGIVVECGHLAEAGVAVQRDGLTELLVRLQAERRQSELTRLALEHIQHALPEPQPMHRVGGIPAGIVCCIRLIGQASVRLRFISRTALHGVEHLQFAHRQAVVDGQHRDTSAPEVFTRVAACEQSSPRCWRQVAGRSTSSSRIRPGSSGIRLPLLPRRRANRWFGWP